MESHDFYGNCQKATHPHIHTQQGYIICKKGNRSKDKSETNKYSN